MSMPAYDLRAFEAGAPAQPREIRSVRGGQPHPKLRRGLRLARVVITLAAMLGMVCALLYSHAYVTELTGEIAATKRSITEARAQYDYLSSELTARASLQNVQLVAGAQLGLMKMDPSQVTYISLETEATISRPETEAQRLLSFVSAAVIWVGDAVTP